MNTNEKILMQKKAPVNKRKSELSKKQVDRILNFGNSVIYPMDGLPMGVTKFQAFLSIKNLIGGKRYWQALRKAYTESDDLFVYYADVKDSFEKKRDEKEYLMTKAERSFVERLPQMINIYRGMTLLESQSEDYSVSWTLKKKTAEFFAFEHNRCLSTLGQKKVVKELTINKKDVVAYFADKKESEIIYIHKTIASMFEKT
jgi:hypothetical protein